MNETSSGVDSPLSSVADDRRFAVSPPGRLQTSTRKRLSLTLTLGSFALVLGMMLFVELSIRQDTALQEEERLRRNQESLALHFRTQAADLLQRTRLLSEPASRLLGDPSGTGTRRAVELAAEAGVDLLVVADPSGTIHLAAGSLLQRADLDLVLMSGLFQRASRGGDLTGTLVLDGEAIQIATRVLREPPLPEGILLLGRAIGPETLSRLEARVGSGLLLLEGRRILASGERIPPELTETPGTDLPDLSRPVIQRTRAANEAYRSLGLPLPGFRGREPLSLVIVHPEGEALAVLQRLRHGTITTAISAVLLSLLGATLLANRIANPLLRLSRHTERMALGDLRHSLTLDTGDEAQELAGTLEHLREKMVGQRRSLASKQKFIEELTRDLEDAKNFILSSSISEYKQLARVIEDAESANRALKEAQGQLIQAGKMAMFGELGAGLVHELRNPLASIRGFAQLAHRDLREDQDKTRKHMALIIKAVDHLGEIVNGLHSYSRKTSFEHKEVDLNNVVWRSCLLLRGQIRKRNIELHTELSDSVPWILGDGNQIQQVITNLVANARDAIGTGGGSIWIRTFHSPESQTVTVEVEDNGPGIMPEHKEKIFQSFFTTKPEGVGTGLGLSIARGIVEEHDAELELESEPGEGARFRITFPTAESRRSIRREPEDEAA